MEPTATDAIIQFIPLLILQALYAAVVFVVARKRGLNPLVRSLISLVPLIGLIFAGLFVLLSFLSVLDRLNRLEKEGVL